jgi:hypothetical protein
MPPAVSEYSLKTKRSVAVQLPPPFRDPQTQRILDLVAAEKRRRTYSWRLAHLFFATHLRRTHYTRPATAEEGPPPGIVLVRKYTPECFHCMTVKLRAERLEERCAVMLRRRRDLGEDAAILAFQIALSWPFADLLERDEELERFDGKIVDRRAMLRREAQREASGVQQ